jgi:cobalt/nickel transport protein
MRRAWWYVLGFAAIAIIGISAFLVSPGAEFGGADGQAEDVIGDIDPDYQPWVENLWEVPGETESLLFALQAAIGASIIGFFIGRYGKVPGGAPESAIE